MTRILFLVKNGIGFGHIRRTLLIADQLKFLDPNIDVVFISQAKSFKLFEEKPYKVINFPILHRVPDEAFYSTYKDLLALVTAEIQPDLVVEETYPDRHYLNIPALQNIPRILLMHRIDPISFDNFRRAGYFSTYDRIVVLHYEHEIFFQEQVPELELLIRLTQKFAFTGPTFHQVTAKEIDVVKDKYVRSGHQLVVINAGAGGDHYNNTYCEQLFKSADEAATRFWKSDAAVDFVVVTGPYYNGFLPSSPNMSVVDFEPHLAALLYIANVAVIRPGYSVTREALAGSAEIVLVPGTSYMESQRSFAKYLSERYEVEIAAIDAPDELFSSVKRLLRKPSFNAERKEVVPRQAKVAEIVLNEVSRIKHIEDYLEEKTFGLPLFILFGGFLSTETERIHSILSKYLPQALFVGEACVPNLDLLDSTRENESPTQALFMQSSTEIDLTPSDLLNCGVKVVFYTDQTTFGVSALEWCRHYRITRYGVLDIELFHFYISKDWRTQLAYRTSKMLSRGIPLQLYLDFSKTSGRVDEIEKITSDICRWCLTFDVRITTIDQLVEQEALRRFA